MDIRQFMKRKKHLIHEV